MKLSLFKMSGQRNKNAKISMSVTTLFLISISTIHVNNCLTYTTPFVVKELSHFFKKDQPVLQHSLPRRNFSRERGQEQFCVREICVQNSLNPPPPPSPSNLSRGRLLNGIALRQRGHTIWSG